MKTTTGLICVLGLIVTGCQNTSSTTLPLSTPALIFPTQEGSPITPSLTLTTPPDADIQTAIQKSKEDLAQRLGVSVDGITVTTVIGQELSTDAFYCKTFKERIAKEESPQVVSGHSILLSVSGRRYEYHAGGQTVIFCRSLP